MGPVCPDLVLFVPGLSFREYSVGGGEWG